MLLSQVLNAIVLIVVGIGLVALVVVNSCSFFPPLPKEQTLEEANGAEVYRFVYALNIVTNVLFAVPGVMLMIMGFPFEGAIYILTAVFSALWHITGSRAMSALDITFSACALLVTVALFLRVVQVRGLPEMWAFYLALPIMAVIMFKAVRGEHVDDWISNRMAHVLWHVLTAALFILVTVELLKTPCLIRNKGLRDAIVLRDQAMWVRAAERNSCAKPSVSIIYGLFKDLGETMKRRKALP